MTGKLEDLKNKRFGLLVVTSRSGTDKFGRATWICKCDCGNETIVTTNRLNTGDTKSCGCLSGHNFRKHGLYRTRLNIIWSDMKQRCYNPKHTFYRHYGGRGITICSDWRDDFLAFYKWAMSSGYSDSLTIDRINNNGNYEPHNCRWATMHEQVKNRRTKEEIMDAGK